MAANAPSDFVEAPWDAPLDVFAYLDDVPNDATMSGLFLASVVKAAHRAKLDLPSARGSYIAFRRYPLREHCQLLAEAAAGIFPDHSMRQGLRRLGRGAPQTLIESMLGRVVFGSAEGPIETIRAMAKSYPLHMSPGTLEITEESPGRVVLAARAIHHFLDSHNVGVFEGVLRHSGAEGGRVTIRSLSRCDADLLCEWQL
ncbi:MAG: DUF2378 family protein [Deltaproteobacteria bacterium]|nr:DUF2378 family protein [Deltaproteobacteria bacterium]